MAKVIWQAEKRMHNRRLRIFRIEGHKGTIIEAKRLGDRKAGETRIVRTAIALSNEAIVNLADLLSSAVRDGILNVYTIEELDQRIEQEKQEAEARRVKIVEQKMRKVRKRKALV